MPDNYQYKCKLKLGLEATYAIWHTYSVLQYILGESRGLRGMDCDNSFGLDCAVFNVPSNTV